LKLPHLKNINLDFHNKIIFGDCLDIMPHIPDSSVDMVLCDLPYGITAPDWDKLVDMDNLWKQYKRIVKPNGTIALFSSQPFTTKLISSNEKDFKFCWYWLKNQGTNFFHAKRMPIRKIEEICIFMGGKYNPQISDGHIPTNSAKGCSNGQAYFGKNKRNYEGGKTTRFPTNILEFKCVDNYSRVHSSEKPINLCEYLIKTHSDEGEVVLDNCAGSGSSLLAARNTGRIFIGIEKEKEYYDIASKRLNDNQLDLFPVIRLET